MSILPLQNAILDTKEKETIMDYPKEITAALLEADYESIFKLQFREQQEAIQAQRVPIKNLYKWSEEHGCPENWMDIFFEYLEKLSQGIRYYRDQQSGNRLRMTWNALYAVDPIINSWLDQSIKQENKKVERLAQLIEELKKFMHQFEQPGFVFSAFVDTFLKKNSEIKKRWNLESAAEIQAGRIFVHQLTDLFHECVDAYTIDEREACYSSFRAVKKNAKGLWARDEADEIEARQAFFLLSTFYPKSYLPLRDFIQKLFTNAKYPDIQLPTAENLHTKGKQVFANNKIEGSLCLLLDYILKAIKIVDIDYLKSCITSGANVSNASGMTSLENSLELLVYFTPYEKQISDFLSNQIKESPQCFILTQAITSNHYSLFSANKKEKAEGLVIKTTLHKIADLKEDSEGQIEIRRYLVRWGYYTQDVLPKKYRIIAPKQLPQDVDSLKKLFSKLKLAKHIKLNRKAKNQEIPANYPPAAKKVYLWKNGSDQSFFEELYKHPSLLRGIKEDLKMHLEDAQGEKFSYNFPEVDIQKHIHDDIVPIGENGAGDYYFVDPKTISIKGEGVVIMYHHDQMLLGTVVANSMVEFIARQLVERCIEIYGKSTKLNNLLSSSNVSVKK